MTIAVFDVGKTNLKLAVADRDGRILDTRSSPNPVYPAPPYQHHDLARLEAWLVEGLREFGSRHGIEAIVTCAHGSGGVLINDDGPAMPMIDYEQPPPAEVDNEYRRIAGSFRERGSPVMLGAAHLARQMLWLETEWPDCFATSKAYLATPQYWAWRLSGVAASEVTSLAAQSHLWNAADRLPAQLVRARGWERLVPPLAPAWSTLGTLRPAFVERTGLAPDVRVICGIHDSSANLYRYEAAGLRDLTVVSTGTWIVALSDRPGSDLDVERPGLCCNADVFGRPLPGMITMGGREFTAVAGTAQGPATRASLHRIVESGTMALPSFGSDDSLFPGSANQGYRHGPLADDQTVSFTLAVLYSALMTCRCLEGVNSGATIVLDGNFVTDPLYGALVAALNPGKTVLVNLDRNGTATGTALLASHETRVEPAPLDIRPPDMTGLPDLTAYQAQWQATAEQRRNVRDHL